MLNDKYKNAYFVIYDLNDNIIAYFDNIDELLNFVKIPKKKFNYRIKNRPFLYYQTNNTYNKIYIFYDEES